MQTNVKEALVVNMAYMLKQKRSGPIRAPTERAPASWGMPKEWNSQWCCSARTRTSNLSLIFGNVGQWRRVLVVRVFRTLVSSHWMSSWVWLQLLKYAVYSLLSWLKAHGVFWKKCLRRKQITRQLNQNQTSKPKVLKLTVVSIITFPGIFVFPRNEVLLNVPEKVELSYSRSI